MSFIYQINTLSHSDKIKLLPYSSLSTWKQLVFLIIAQQHSKGIHIHLSYPRSCISHIHICMCIHDEIQTHPVIFSFLMVIFYGIISTNGLKVKKCKISIRDVKIFSHFIFSGYIVDNNVQFDWSFTAFNFRLLVGDA